MGGLFGIEDSWVKEVDIDPEMVKAYLEGLAMEVEKNTMPSPKSRRGRSARTHHVKSRH